MADLNLLSGKPIAIIGAGIMGVGIVQIAALAGHPVLLFDARAGAAAQGKANLAGVFDALVVKGKLQPDAAVQALGRITPVEQISQLNDAALVIEAVVESMEVKRALFAQLERVVTAQCILASNTSSLSITAMARELANPARLVGMHFFNPVPLMKLVEVVSGVHTDAGAAGQVFALAQAWGKTPVHARSTPGFVVNRIARPFYAEALALVHERAATPDVIDACLRAAGFRMGPCELMDLIGHDTNFAVTRTVFEANFFDQRYAPSLVQAQLVDAGFLGRKTGRGFYVHPHTPPVFDKPAPYEGVAIAIEGGFAIEGGLLLRSDGRRARELAVLHGNPNLLVFDRSLAEPGVLAFAAAPKADEVWLDRAQALLSAQGFTPVRIADTPGLVVTRTIAMLINEAADAVQQGVCDAGAADAAMKLGVNFPAGPFEWLEKFGAEYVTHVLDALNTVYRDERYRASIYL